MFAPRCFADAIPELRPAEGLLPPTFWERHGLELLLLVLLGMLLLLLFLWARWKVAAALPTPEQIVRKTLLPLETAPENSILAGLVLKALRAYLPAALAWPPGERTVDEIILRLQVEPKLAAELNAEIASLLRHCEQRQFFTGRLGRDGRLASRAQVIVEKVAAVTGQNSTLPAPQ